MLINFWGVVGIVACVFSGIGLGNFNAEQEKNRWMAIVGLILGILSVFYGVISLLA